MTAEELRAWLLPETWTGPGAALAILGIAVAIALLLEWLHHTVFRRLASRTSSTYDDIALDCGWRCAEKEIDNKASSAATKWISDVPGFVKHTSTPLSTRVLTRLCAPVTALRPTPPTPSLTRRRRPRERSCPRRGR